MRKVIGIGETVLDIVFRDNQPIAAVPGGSTFNAMISLGRSGVPATLISEVGDDRVGRFVTDFMRHNGVDPLHMSLIPGAKTPLSLAFLNEKNDAEYIFYKTTPPQGRGVNIGSPNEKSNQPPLSWGGVGLQLSSDDLVLFGSYYALNPDTRQQVKAVLEEARRQGAIIYYDVNFRPAHCHEVMRLMPAIMENLEMADIVRGSREDFETLYQIGEAEKVYAEKIAYYCRNFIYTDSDRPALLMASDGLRREYPVKKEQTVTTIGAGDNFNAGILFGILRQGITRQDIAQGLTAVQWDSIIAEGQQFAAEVCKSIYNYVSEDFGQAKRATLPTK